MIVNIVDKRTDCYNVFCRATYRSAMEDNNKTSTNQYTWGKKDFLETLYCTTIVDALEYGQQFDFPVTMYINDR